MGRAGSEEKPTSCCSTILSTTRHPSPPLPASLRPPASPFPHEKLQAGLGHHQGEDQCAGLVDCGLVGGGLPRCAFGAGERCHHWSAHSPHHYSRGAHEHQSFGEHTGVHHHFGVHQYCGVNHHFILLKYHESTTSTEDFSSMRRYIVVHCTIYANCTI